MGPIKPYPVQAVKPFLACGADYDCLMNMRAVLANNLQAQLNIREWGQQELHRRSKVAQSTIGRILRQETAADIETLGQIAKALGIEPWALLAPDFGKGTVDLFAAISQLARKHK